MRQRAIVVALLAGLACGFAAQSACAARITGTIESIAGKVQTLIILDSATQQSIVVTVGKDTQFVNASSLRDFALQDVVTVDVEPGKAATRLARAVVSIMPDQMLSTQEMQALLGKPGTFTLVDARPRIEFEEGHLPGAISIFVEELAANWDQLPADKARLIVFYCSGSS